MIKNATIPPHLKQVYEHMSNLYQESMPESLYWNYYRLEEETGIPSDQWETFLDIPEVDRWVEHKIAKMTEFSAKEALYRLSTDPNLSSSDVAAIRELLSSSKLMKQRQEQPTQVVLMKY